MQASILLKIRIRNLAAVAVMAATLSLSGLAQSTPTQSTPPQPTPVAQAPASPEAAKPSPETAKPLSPKQRELNVATAKLVALANELKAEMDKSSKDTLSLGVMRKAEEVEKQARIVRDKMRAVLAN